MKYRDDLDWSVSAIQPAWGRRIPIVSTAANAFDAPYGMSTAGADLGRKLSDGRLLSELPELSLT
jgi:hypothetical protein